MCARPDQPDRRDRAMDRLIEEALKPSAPSAAIGTPACPDAELVAAYADQGLSDDDRSRLEVHFAGCDHCQQVLAQLGAALEAPVGASVSVMPAPAKSPVAARPAPSVQRWLWWLSPAFGAAAAALMWMVLRPAAPVPVQTAVNFPATAEQEAKVLNAPAAALPQPQAPPAAVTRRDEQALDRLSKMEPTEQEAADATQERAFAQLAAPLGSVSATPPAQTEGRASAAPQAAVAQTGIAPEPAAESGLMTAEPSPAGNEIAVADTRASLEARATGALGSRPQQTVAGARGNAQAVPDARLVLYTFSPPNGGATWHLGTGGLIERSIDQGSTWQPQASGVTNDLIAGSASSPDVAWVVGRGNVILRTTDGRNWQRVSPPTGVTGQWAAVAAYDAMSATVIADDLRRYSTRDGGLTWVQQQ